MIISMDEMDATEVPNPIFPCSSLSITTWQLILIKRFVKSSFESNYKICGLEQKQTVLAQMPEHRVEFLVSEQSAGP